MLTRRSHARFEIADKRRLTFYAAVFNVPTWITEQDGTGKMVRYQEVIAPTAFDAALASSSEVIANIDHDEAQTFATRSTKALLLQADPYGLFCSCWLPETPEGDRTLERVQAGELDGCSFRFVPITDNNRNGVIERASVKLYDVCLTASPAYEATKGEVHVRNIPDDRMKFLSARYRYAKIKSWILHKGNS